MTTPGSFSRSARHARGGVALALVGLVALLIVVGAGAFVGFGIVRAANLHLALSPGARSVSLVQPVLVTARVDAPMKITLDGTISAKVPLKQTLALPVKGRYQTDFDLDTMVPLRCSVDYEGVLPIDTLAAIQAHTSFDYGEVKYVRNLAFAAKLPMKLNVPVKLHVPIDQSVRIRYHGPLTVDIDQTIHAPVDIEIPADIHVNKDFVTDVTSLVHLRVLPPKDALNVLLSAPDLALPLSSLRLEQAPDPSQPTRHAEAVAAP